MPWVTQTTEIVDTADPTKATYFAPTTGSSCFGLPLGQPIPVGYKVEKQEEVDSEGAATNNYRTLFTSPSGMQCVADTNPITPGSYGGLILLLGAAAAFYFLFWQGRK